MKKFLLIMGCAGLFAMSSCTKQYVTPNPNQTILFNVAATDWQSFTDPSGVKSYVESLAVPEISSSSADSDGVLVYLAFSNGVYEQVPEVYAGIAYSFTYNAGNITIYAQNSDGTVSATAPPAATAKVVLVPSSQ
jgi:hypothetical protein